jgi:hypothetical protein
MKRDLDEQQKGGPTDDLESAVRESGKKLTRWWIFYLTIAVLAILWFVWSYWPS